MTARLTEDVRRVACVDGTVIEFRACALPGHADRVLVTVRHLQGMLTVQLSDSDLEELIHYGRCRLVARAAEKARGNP